MDVKQAVETAKNYIGELFGNEGVVNLGLEEVEFDEQSNTWLVTLGFSRPWDRSPSALAAVSGAYPARSYKVVRVAEPQGRVLSVKNREPKS